MENSEGRHPCIPSRVDAARPFPSVPFIRKDNILVELEIIVVFTDEPKTVLQDSGQKVVLPHASQTSGLIILLRILRLGEAFRTHASALLDWNYLGNYLH